MSTIHKISDSLPGGEGRASARLEIEQAEQASKNAKAVAKATKETNRPIRTKAGVAIGVFVVGGVIFNLSKNDGGEAIGESFSNTARTGVEVVAGVGSVGVDVASGAISGTREGVDELRQEANIELDNPLTRDDDQPVSNTVPSSEPSSPTSSAPETYTVVAGDGPASIARLCGSLAVSLDDKVSHYESVIVPLSPDLQDGMPNPGDIAVCK